MEQKQLEHNFTYHAPDAQKRELHEHIREEAFSFACVINALPESREKAIAITKIEEAVMWANACVARF